MKLWRYGRAIERLGQRYRLEGVLGSGGMADVCLAWDERAQREVAIKVIKPNELDQRSLDRFLKEAAQVAQWRHPNILRIYGEVKLELLDASHGSIVPYIVMEYAQGGDLHKRMTAGEPYPLGETLSIFAQLCGAVAYAHSHNIIHRDLKPLNILFRVLENHTEQAVLSDFGLAVDAGATHFTFAGAGTLPYMAPEQLRGHAQAASDIFALGVVLYQLVTGHLPFQRELQDLRHPLVKPVAVSSLNPDLPVALDTVIFKALSEDPAQRHPDALSLWEEIYAVIANDPRLDALLIDLGGQTSDMAPIVLSSFTTPAPPVSQVDKTLRRNVEGGEMKTEGGASLRQGQGQVVKRTPMARLTIPQRQQGHVDELATAEERQMMTRSQPRQLVTNIEGVADGQTHDFYVYGVEDDSNDDDDEAGVEYASDKDRRNEGVDEWLADNQSVHLDVVDEDGQIHTGRDFDSAIYRQPTRRQSARDADKQIITNIPRRYASNAYPDPDQSQAPITRRRRGVDAGLHRIGTSPTASTPPTPSQRSQRSQRGYPNQTVLLPETGQPSQHGQPRSAPGPARRRGQTRPPTLPVQQNISHINHTRRRYTLIAIPSLLLLLGAGILIFLHPFNPGGAAATTTSRQTVTGTYTITATTTPDPTQQQIALHKLSITLPPATQTVTGTGHTQIPATQATGTLTFFNGAFNTFVVKAGTIIQSANGNEFVTTEDITIPSADINTGKTGQMSGLAKASQAGAQGNIAALAINSTCCIANGTIFVKNNNAFTGGQDAQNYTFVQQSDVDQAVGVLETSQLRQGMPGIQGQLQPYERLANAVQCGKQTVTEDHPVGAQGVNVSVLTATVTSTCTGIAYDYGAVQRLATADLAAQVQANTQLKGFAEVGTTQVQVLSVQVNADGTVTLRARAAGVWAR